MLSKNTFAILALTALFFTATINAADSHKHQATSEVDPQKSRCEDKVVTCAKTVTSAFAPNGDLWRLWVISQAMYYQISKDNGKSFSPVVQVAIAAEKISARNENRPKIAFDNYEGVYLSWAMPRARKYTADVRFSYSKDYGKSFSKPITVNNDKVLTGHSFNEMLVTEEGDISLVWLDGRLAHKLSNQGKKAHGSALFLAQANFREHKSTFTNKQLANNTCVCCRIAMTYNQQGDLAILWRHIYGDNIREFALLTFSETSDQSQPIQISHDHWKINGCPHQGGGISVDEDNRYHIVWFNMGEKGKGIFYANTLDQGKTLSTPLSIGELTAQAAHPHVQQHDQRVDIVWTQFNGLEHQLWHLQSRDKGKTFTKAKKIAQASSGSDRPFIIKQSGVHYVSWHRPKQGHLVQAL
ncbi:MAG: sialidase family protein [Litorilituus sp.]|nr:sialidase family protein [Litorilituus sp.]